MATSNKYTGMSINKELLAALEAAAETEKQRLGKVRYTTQQYIEDAHLAFQAKLQEQVHEQV